MLRREEAINKKAINKKETRDAYRGRGELATNESNRQDLPMPAINMPLEFIVLRLRESQRRHGNDARTCCAFSKSHLLRLFTLH